MQYTALIPVKTLDLAKSRLAPHLSRQQRVTLVLAMLQRVIQVLHASRVFEQIYVVSADSRVLERIQDWGAQPLQETQPGHNPALQEAAHTIMRAWTASHQTPDVRNLPSSMGLLTLSADLPLLAQEDLALLMQAAEQAQVVLARSSDGTGTNALLTRPPLALPYLFGPHSLSAYIQAAQQAKMSYKLIHNAHLALDIDTRADLAQLARYGNDWLRMTHYAMETTLLD